MLVAVAHGGRPALPANVKRELVKVLVLGDAENINRPVSEWGGVEDGPGDAGAVCGPAGEASRAPRLCPAGKRRHL